MFLLRILIVIKYNSKQMGNKMVYQDGKFITPIKIQRQLKITDQSQFNYENVFGKVEIPSARAEPGDSLSDQENFKTHKFNINYYRNDLQQYSQCVSQQKSKTHFEALKSVENIIESDRQNKSMATDSQMKQSKCISKSIIDQSQYQSCARSPVKDENRTPEQSYIQIFQSRHQSQYFKFNTQ